MAQRSSSLLMLALSVALFAPFVAPSQEPSPSNVTHYPNNSDGLKQLLNKMLIAAKNEDRSELLSMIRQAEIPDYEHWFTKTFGQEKGQSWADPYGRGLTRNEKEFEELLSKLANMDGEFVIEKIDTANRYDTLNGSLDEYLASWKKPGPPGDKLVHIADFFFVEGEFRWDSTVQYFPFRKPNAAFLVPPKVVKKVQPEYPAEAQARRIEGTVKLQVIIRKDGSVTVQNVLEGDPAPPLPPSKLLNNGDTSLGHSTASRWKFRRKSQCHLL